MILIDAHGPEHGLKVEFTAGFACRNADGTLDYDPGEVRITEWGECCEPDEYGSYRPHLRTAVVSTRDLLAGPHMAGEPPAPSMHDRIIRAATAYLAHHGGDETLLPDSDRPCDHFDLVWGINAKARPACPVCA